MREVRARAPGKLILSGEHSVVYGAPALATAVNRYVETRVISAARPGLNLQLADLGINTHSSYSELVNLQQRLEKSYQEFLQGKLTINDLALQPQEILQYAVIKLLSPIMQDFALEIHLTANLPYGSGMGSSAAAILSLLSALGKFYTLDLDQQTYLNLAQAAENLQHGRSSGLDLKISWQGGCHWFQAGETQMRKIFVPKIYALNTGIPRSSTGQCVAQVQKYFTRGYLRDEFAMITKVIDQALQNQNSVDLYAGIRENHRLLNQIGVVPAKIQQLIQEIEQLAGAAKICGAGAVVGENAGMVLVLLPDLGSLQALLAKYNYPLMELAVESKCMAAESITG